MFFCSLLLICCGRRLTCLMLASWLSPSVCMHKANVRCPSLSRSENIDILSLISRGRVQLYAVLPAWIWRRREELHMLRIRSYKHARTHAPRRRSVCSRCRHSHSSFSSSTSSFFYNMYCSGLLLMLWTERRQPLPVKRAPLRLMCTDAIMYGCKPGRGGAR